MFKSVPFIAKYTRLNKWTDLYRMPVGYVIITAFALFPILVAVWGGQLEGYIKGHAVNEGNSSLVSFGWLAILTLPAGIGMAGIWTLIWISRILEYARK